MDVGCGTGILSMFAVQAGAKHVYAVDCSSIIEQAQQIIDINGFSDSITCIRGKVEEIDLPVSIVDVIVSEWMGYFLLYESMLDTVLYARDKWLRRPGGVIFPDKAVMYLCGVEDAAVKRERIDFWDNVYGFDMRPIKDIALKEPVVDVVGAKVRNNNHDCQRETKRKRSRRVAVAFIHCVCVLVCVCMCRHSLNWNRIIPLFLWYTIYRPS